MLPREIVPLALLFLLLATHSASAAAADDWMRLVAAGELIEISKVDPTIAVDLRYASERNGAGAKLYPLDFPCLVRPEIATRLRLAQQYLRANGRGLKIWDAYRPAAAQEQLWKREKDRRFVANPTEGRGSLHTWGLAVDVTLVDLAGREVPMPTDFDVFERVASGIYAGKSEEVRKNLQLLQYAMMRIGGFQGLSTEWWHFAVRGWRDYKPLSTAAQPSKVGGS